MIPAPLASNEKERLESLLRLNLLDTPIEERFERITRMLCRVLGVPIAAFTLVDEGRQWFKSIQGLNVTQTPRDHSFCAHAILDSDMIVVEDAGKDARFAANPLVTGAPNITFYAGCPVRAPDGNYVGTLCVIDTKPRVLNADEAQTLRDLAAIIESELRANVLSRTQNELIAQLDRAHRLTMVDPLTRVWNRSGIHELLKREWSEAKRKKSTLAVAMADIDYLKDINDKYGHAAGDEVLEEVARRLVGAARTEDIVGRAGGEEFLVVLPGCSVESVRDTAERIRIAVCATPIATAAGKLGVSISFGAAVVKLGVVPGPVTCFEQLIKQADDALHAAKKAGRNNVQTAA